MSNRTPPTRRRSNSRAAASGQSPMDSYSGSEPSAVAATGSGSSHDVDGRQPNTPSMASGSARHRTSTTPQYHGNQPPINNTRKALRGAGGSFARSSSYEYEPYPGKSNGRGKGFSPQNIFLVLLALVTFMAAYRGLKNVARSRHTIDNVSKVNDLGRSNAHELSRVSHDVAAAENLANRMQNLETKASEALKQTSESIDEVRREMVDRSELAKQLDKMKQDLVGDEPFSRKLDERFSRMFDQLESMQTSRQEDLASVVERVSQAESAISSFQADLDTMSRIREENKDGTIQTVVGVEEVVLNSRLKEMRDETEARLTQTEARLAQLIQEETLKNNQSNAKIEELLMGLNDTKGEGSGGSGAIQDEVQQQLKKALAADETHAKMMDQLRAADAKHQEMTRLYQEIKEAYARQASVIGEGGAPVISLGNDLPSVDWASASMGGSIVYYLTSKGLGGDDTWETLLHNVGASRVFADRYKGLARPPTKDPVVTISGSPSELSPGNCFAFQGSGNLTVQLSRPVFVDEIRIENVAPHLTPQGIDSAPKEFELFGLPSLSAEELNEGLNRAEGNMAREKEGSEFSSQASRLWESVKALPSWAWEVSRRGYAATGRTMVPSVKMGEFSFDYPNVLTQTFRALPQDRPMRRITFAFATNEAGPFTCVYRVRVFGSPEQPKA
eukprot:GHVN01058856.1.p1 GENE.GHVN01058856.1~~GHVN01058856.1.p1  ORF type:complete len:674 (+),score=81.47 GHVN01058856.1:2343-4364(+)